MYFEFYQDSEGTGFKEVHPVVLKIILTRNTEVSNTLKKINDLNWSFNLG